MSEFIAFSIQHNALASLQGEFKKAAKVGLKKNAQLLEKLVTSGVNVGGHLDVMQSSVENINFLVKGSNLDYSLQAQFNSNCGKGLTIWNDYLAEIDKLNKGLGCYPNNDNQIQKLIDQNGPKKMETRLRNFLKRRIEKSVIAAGVPSYVLKK